MSQLAIKTAAFIFKRFLVNASYPPLILKLISSIFTRRFRLQVGKKRVGKRPTRLYEASALIISFASVAAAQNYYEHTKDKVDQTLRSNARINPSTLAVELAIPIADLPGRGGASMPLVFNYSSKVWELRPTGLKYGSSQFQEEVRPMYSDEGTAGWTSSYDVLTIDTIVESYNCYGGATSGEQVQPAECYNAVYYVKRIRVKLPGGTTHELRKDDLIYENPYGVMDTTGTFYAVDGSRVRLEWGTAGESTLFMPDGGRYFFADNGNNPPRCYKYIDRHGNTLDYNPTAQAWTDTMGRTLPSPRQPNRTEGTQNYTVPGLGSTTRQYQFVWKKLSTGALVAGDSLSYVTRNCLIGAPPRSPILFASTMAIMPCDGTAGYFDPVVLNEIILPNGQKYKFAYNTFGEIARIDYPTGAYEKFTYASITGLGWDYQQNYTTAISYGKANRGVVDRYVGADGAAGEQHWHYSAGYQTTATYGADTYVMATTAPDNTVSKRFLHRTVRPQFADEPIGNYGFDTLLAGREMETQTLDSTGTIRSRTLFEWEMTEGAMVGYTNAIPQRDARLKRQINIIIEPGATSGLASMSATTYDSNADLGQFAQLNAKQTKTYQYKVLALATAQTGNLTTIAGQFTASDVQSIAETDYLYDPSYKDRGIVGLPIEQRVMNPASPTNFVAKSQISYDELAYPVLTYGATPTAWEDPGITAQRGLVTTTKTWDSSANNGAGNWIVSHAQYDQFGNVRKSWMPKYEGSNAPDRISQTEYSSTYNYAYPTKVITPAPGNGTNGSAAGFATAMSYDFATGLPLTSTDANGLETRMEYDDPLLRPTKISTYFLGQPVGGTSETFYGAPNSAGQLPATERFVKVRSSIDVTSAAESLSWFDGLGRTVKTQKKDAQGDVFSFVCYDQMSRPFKSSNPFRGAEPANPCGSTQADLHWTTSIFDDLGRATEIRSPLESGQTMSAKVLTSYSLATTGAQIGTVVTVTDQAGKKRRSITNALGQLVRVDEPDAAGSLDAGDITSPKQPTVYSYDALSNLATVTQAGQTRQFAYDSLSRLKSAQNPESGLINYTYDANGNLLTKQDARNVTTSFVYDALNRVTGRSYSDGATPAVSYYYDGLGLPTVPAHSKGKLTKVSSNVSETRYTAFDELGRIKASQQITDNVTYNFADYTYNLAGALVSQTYPSGRTVRNVFDADGDLAAVSSRSKQTNPLKPYAANFSYTAHGAVAAMQLGNNRWETKQFNNRLQPTQLGLGTTNVAANADLWKATFNYGTTDNNGNVKSQTIVVPTAGGNPGFMATQTYGYDSLNRLQDAKEMIGGAQTWKQTFVYDRFGNRRFDLANTTTPTSAQGLPKVINPEIDPSNNRIKQTQYGESNIYLYDAAGNLTKDALGKQFVYDAENKQCEVKDAGNNSLGRYVYDGDGKRVKKDTSTETTIFVYDASGKLAAEYSTTAPPPPAVATTSYLTNDHLGSPRVITDSTGKVTSRRDFLPFGEDLSTPQRIPQLGYAADTVRQKFTGYQKDTESGLDFAKARMYGGSHGRLLRLIRLQQVPS